MILLQVEGLGCKCYEIFQIHGSASFPYNIREKYST